MWKYCWVVWFLVQLYGIHATNICCSSGCRVTHANIIGNNNTLEIHKNESLDINSLDFPGFSTNCRFNLHTLVINTDVTIIGDFTFQQAYFLATIDASGVTHIGAGAFTKCILLVVVFFPSVVTIGTGAFASCTALKSVSIPVIRTIGFNAFEGTSALTDLYIATSSNTIDTNAFLNSYLISVNCYNAPIVEDTYYNIVNCVDTIDDNIDEILCIGVFVIGLAFYAWCLVRMLEPPRKQTIQIIHKI